MNKFYVLLNKINSECHVLQLYFFFKLKIFSCINISNKCKSYIWMSYSYSNVTQMIVTTWMLLWWTGTPKLVTPMNWHQLYYLARVKIYRFTPPPLSIWTAHASSQESLCFDFTRCLVYKPNKEQENLCVCRNFNAAVQILWVYLSLNGTFCGVFNG